MKKKIVVAGAGSASFTRGILFDIVNSDSFRGSAIVLLDVNEEKTEIMTRFARKLMYEHDTGIAVEGTNDGRHALKEADYVISTIAVGEIGARWNEINIPLKYGCLQTVGDTVGPGAIFRGLRHIPVTLDICRNMEELCPDAWFFNYANPMSTITRAVNKATGIKCLGLCHAIFETRSFLRGLFGCAEDELNVRAAGVNHFSWYLDIRVNGIDMYPVLDSLIADKKEEIPVAYELLKTYKCLPYINDRHIAEFFSYYTASIETMKKYNLKVDNVEQRQITREKKYEVIKREMNGEAKFELTPSGEKVVDIIKSIEYNRNAEFDVNIPNSGYIKNIPAEAVIEIPAKIGKTIDGIEIGNLPVQLSEVIFRSVVEHELTVEAALSGDRHTVVQAMLANPMLTSVRQAEKITDDLLHAQKAYLPQFE